jgi:hypothetical protein
VLVKRTFFDSLLVVLTGASWAFAFIGAGIGVYLFHPFGFLSALMVAFVCALPGMLCVVFFELAQIQQQKLREIQRQTKLLESIESQLYVHSVPHH